MTSDGFRSLLMKSANPADLVISGDLVVRAENLIEVTELFSYLEAP